MKATRSGSRAWFVWIALLLVVGCGSDGDSPEGVEIARIDDERFTVEDFASYTDANLLEGDEGESADVPGSADGDSLRVRSRLFDTFVEERLLIAEARSRNIVIDDAVLDEYLGGNPGAARLEETRYRLMIELLQEQVFKAQPDPGPEEIATYLEQHRDRLSVPPRLELRALMLPSIEVAEKVYRDLRKRRITFDEAVARHEATPGQSGSTQVAWDNLPEPVQQALDGVKRGRVSEPVELNGDVYIFRVETALKGEKADEGEALARAALEVRAVQRKQAFEQLLQEAREAHRVRLRTDRLPFRYIPES